MYSSTILNLSTSWRWVVSFTPQPLYPRGKSTVTHWIAVYGTTSTNCILLNTFIELPGKSQKRITGKHRMMMTMIVIIISGLPIMKHILYSWDREEDRLTMRSHVGWNHYRELIFLAVRRTAFLIKTKVPLQFLVEEDRKIRNFYYITESKNIGRTKSPWHLLKVTVCVISWASGRQHCLLLLPYSLNMNPG
jgi:hypothetical protein